MFDRCKTGPRTGAKSAGPFCLSPMNHATTKADQAWDIGLTDKPGCTQMNDAQAKNPSDYKPRRRVGNQIFTLILGQEKVA